MKRTCSLLSLFSLLSVLLMAPGLAYAVPTAGVGPGHKAAGANKAGGNKPLLAAVDKSTLRANPAVAAQRAVGKGGKAKPCYAKPVQLLRVRGAEVEPREVSLTMCSGAPNPSALDSISVLGRPRDVERPPLEEIRGYRALPVARGKASARNKTKKFQNPAFVTDHVLRLNAGLLARLQKIAKHYPGHVIEIISGYRPDSRETSRHHHGLALDLRVAGVRRERLRDYLRTFEDTGVGYYPNSFFVHMDVRDSKGYWVDRSGPGEPADYGPWPVSPRRSAPQLAKRSDGRKDNLLKGALADLDALRGPLARHSGSGLNAGSLGKAGAHTGDKPREPEHEGDEMSQNEVQRARDEARRALEGL